MSNFKIQPLYPNTKRNLDDMIEKAAINKLPSATLIKLLNMSTKNIIDLYCHNHKEINHQQLADLINYKPTYFFNAGSDAMKLMYNNEEKMCLIEVNSVATGSMSFPSIDTEYYNQYDYIIRESFMPLISIIPKSSGVLAVLDDALYPEGYSYALTMSRIANETVYLVNMAEDYHSYFRINDDYLELYLDNEWKRIRACYKYVQIKPWLKLPLKSNTFIFNHLLACLAGGRNKAVASLAYNEFNKSSPIQIRHPFTVVNLSKEGVIKLVKERGMGVAKGLYGNGGEEVFFLLSDREIEKFSNLNLSYDKYIYQDLIGLESWFNEKHSDRYYHIGTKEPEKRVFDLRMCIAFTKDGYRPSSMFSRRAKIPLNNKFQEITDYRKLLSTNIGGSIDYYNQVIILDDEGMDLIGLKLDNLIDAFIQTVLAAIAIDKMATSLVESGKFDCDKYYELNRDQKLYQEIKQSIN